MKASTAFPASRFERPLLLSDLLDELLLRQSLPPGWGADVVRPWRETLTTRSDIAQPCGVGRRTRDLRGEQERPEPDRRPRERVGAALLAVDDADDRRDVEPGLAERLDRLERRAAGGDDVLDEADALAGLEDALDPVARAVVLGRVRARSRTAGRPRARRPRRAAPRRARARRAGRVGLVLAHGGGDRGAEGAAADRAVSRSGTCRGSRCCACPSGAGSRPRGARRRGSRRRALACVDISRERESTSRASESICSSLVGALGERDHRAVARRRARPARAVAPSGAGRAPSRPASRRAASRLSATYAEVSAFLRAPRRRRCLGGRCGASAAASPRCGPRQCLRS